MNEFLLGLTRFAVRAVLLLTGLVFFLGLLAVAAVLLLVWAARAVWARLTGRPVAPWVMPMRATASWSSMRQHAQGFSARTRGTADPAPPSRRGGVLPQATAEVTDVQAREVR